MSKNKKLKEPILFSIDDIYVEFYYYNFNNETKKFNVSHIDIIKISFIQTNKWYKFYIFVNDVFTGRYLNLISINSIDYYSIRTEIGIAYKNFIDGIFYEQGNINNKIVNIPVSEKIMVENLFKNYIYPIKKYNRRDELTKLNLI